MIKLEFLCFVFALLFFLTLVLKNIFKADDMPIIFFDYQ